MSGKDISSRVGRASGFIARGSITLIPSEILFEVELDRTALDGEEGDDEADEEGEVEVELTPFDRAPAILDDVEEDEDERVACETAEFSCSVDFEFESF